MVSTVMTQPDYLHILPNDHLIEYIGHYTLSGVDLHTPETLFGVSRSELDSHANMCVVWWLIPVDLLMLMPFLRTTNL